MLSNQVIRNYDGVDYEVTNYSLDFCFCENRVLLLCLQSKKFKIGICDNELQFKIMTQNSKS